MSCLEQFTLIVTPRVTKKDGLLVNSAQDKRNLKHLKGWFPYYDYVLKLFHYESK